MLRRHFKWRFHKVGVATRSLVETPTRLCAGDGLVDAAEASLAWTSVVPVRLFAAFPDQLAVAVPMPCAAGALRRNRLAIGFSIQ